MKHKMYKRSLFAPLLVIAAMVLVSSAHEVAAQTKQIKPEITLKCSHGFSPAMNLIQGWVWWADQVTKRTEGRIQFKWYHGGALSKPGEEQEHCRTGFVDMVGSSATWHAHMALWEMNGSLPFQPSDTLLAVKTKWQLYQEFAELRQEIEQKNQRLILITPYGDYHIISRTPLKTLTDLKGLKVAVLGRQQPKWIEPMGAIPTFIPGPARYEALEKGAVQASLMGGIGTTWGFRHHEVCKNMLLAGLGQYCSFFVTMNQGMWNKISPDDQKLMMDLSETVMYDWFPKKLAEEALDYRKKMEEAGVTFQSLSDKDRISWARSLPNLAKDWINEAADAAGKDLRKRIWSRYLEITAKGGYAWPMDWSKID